MNELLQKSINGDLEILTKCPFPASFFFFFIAFCTVYFLRVFTNRGLSLGDRRDCHLCLWCSTVPGAHAALSPCVMSEWIPKCRCMVHEQYRLLRSVLDEGLWPWKLNTNFIFYMEQKAPKLTY